MSLHNHESTFDLHLITSKCDAPARPPRRQESPTPTPTPPFLPALQLSSVDERSTSGAVTNDRYVASGQHAEFFWQRCSHHRSFLPRLSRFQIEALHLWRIRGPKQVLFFISASYLGYNPGAAIVVVSQPCSPSSKSTMIKADGGI